MAGNEARCGMCGSGVESLGQVPLLARAPDPKGALPTWVDVLIFGHKLPSPKSLWPVEVFRCTKCGRLEMYDPGRRLPAARRE
jgi:hypothetical protein